eukprot:COSAG01_NODE_51020_length_358_cov_0.888031_2_plen_48_part_01
MMGASGLRVNVVRVAGVGGGDPGEHSDWVGCMRRFNAELRPGGCIVAG